MRSVVSFNEGWSFHEGFGQRLLESFDGAKSISLPHTAVELPFNYFDEKSYQRAFTYQKVLRWLPEFEGREVSLVFDAAMADSVVYLNGEEIVAHKDGYTPFEARLTGKLLRGENLVTVKIDGSENPDIPPFGGRIDYLTYAGIYRDVWLKVTDPVSIRNLKIETTDVLASEKSATIRVDIANPERRSFSATVTAALKQADGTVIATAATETIGDRTTLSFGGLAGIALWDITDPTLYEVTVELRTEHGSDRLSTRFGFRTAEFTPEGFLLNGKPLKLRGLNRHQAFPYVGYAAGRSAQERDADIMKNVLKCNIVRTSHYPQSKWFLDRCDAIGLLVFEEIPGWQHIGDADWQKESIENVRRMIERDWNHPSIVIWGVRINESQDNHDFYVETNRLARELDSTRQTGGVRYLTESELLEDVYTMNDFILGNEELPGANRPRTVLRGQQENTGLSHKVPYLITEFNGHMHPTKIYDQEQRQAEHVRRHLEVLNAAYGDPDISGAIGWCMFDYNTHKDFGSGDRICYHGVMDMFREPKFAAYAYISQCDPSEEIVMKPVTFWARGERNIGGVLPLIILTNCDEVELQYGALSKRIGPDRENYPHLPHPPVVLDHRHFTADELGTWGLEWIDGTFTGYIVGEPVVSLKLAADPLPTTLEMIADSSTLKARERDSTRVIIRALDQCGQRLPFMNDSISLRVHGPARIVGPANVPLQGGTAGFWLEATGLIGEITVEAVSSRFAPVTLAVTATA
ncbi:glycoside hydrolase family 2 protein [Rhizobium bangladeshense]|uniref:Glycoside hydrolase family 2 protein n=1 Tax=Rhizobium bangladeshense TaxID=1138189 RepID=A0ABS7LKQ7_9HYPH|nr:glycoside hydrolase family 2 TIM barrel-domain containing protein [Rhizobium bangladeshense]MBX4868582.1 glycoside hydrolase family 2 protein [Rhizobium bangladeshense]MBX4873963.1 glycoside hydrolase family 2 protein [Rhizobium bangladeshense]MBX4884973.1 glycoside hydrolase family 2 protein [Rhizobium bangladeshense]MBX4933557.1 glycoside hydrolase family 2 protein [Rhizobium bangladeshense]MBY3592087.1 glycoside hydrolase family 2 protein [Rhizobium bangladeshense]